MVIGNRTIASKINHWLIDGDNSIVITLRPLTVPPDLPDYETSLIGGRQGEMPGPDDTLFRFSLRDLPDPTILAVDTAVEVARVTLPVSHGFGRWAWQDAEPLAATQQDQILTAYQRIATALATGAIDDAVGQLDLMIRERSRSLGVPETEIRDDLRDAVGQALGGPPPRIIATPAEAVSVTPMAGGRLALVTAPDGGAPILYDGGEERWSLRPVFVHAEGRWQVGY
ncbi:MAG: hypothetical protein RLY86_33 [Pseudomonadota bacterium]